MGAPESPFERYMSEQILFFTYLMCSSVSGAKTLKQRACDLLYSISVKVIEHYWNRIKRIWSDRAKIAIEKKYLEIKKNRRVTLFYFLYVELATVQIWEQLNKFPLTHSSLRLLPTFAGALREKNCMLASFNKIPTNYISVESLTNVLCKKNTILAMFSTCQEAVKHKMTKGSIEIIGMGFCSTSKMAA